MVEGRSLADLLTAYDEQCARTDEIIAAHDLSDRGVGGQFPRRRHKDYQFAFVRAVVPPVAHPRDPN